MERRRRAGRSRARPTLSSDHSRSFKAMSRDFALQGGPCPHSPAVARGHRATSPVRAETLFHLAFSGIAASPPCAFVQIKQPPTEDSEGRLLTSLH